MKKKRYQRKFVHLITCLWYWLAFTVNKKNGKTRFTSWRKLVTEFQFESLLDPGVKSKNKPIYESRKMVLNRAQDQTEK